MRIEFDPGKDEVNRRKHGVALSDPARINFETASVIVDERAEYGEVRFRAYGLIGGRLHMLAFTMRGYILRAISLRKANATETRRHGQHD